MKVCLDMDGCLYEWSKTARYMLREYKGYSKNGPMGSESTSWDYIQGHIAAQDWEWLWSEGITLGLFRYGHVVTGAQVGVRKLREAGHTVHIVTHRPAEAVPDTIAWLDLFQNPGAGVVLDGVHILTNGEAKSSVLGDILIDDAPKNIEDWVGHARRGILFDREWNQGAKPAGSLRAYGWFDVPRAVEEISDHHQRNEDNGGREASRDRYKRLFAGSNSSSFRADAC